MSNMYRLLYSIIIISFVSVGVYWNTLSSDFVWDDIDLIAKNEAIRVLDSHALWSYFSDDEVTKAPGEIYRPLYILSFALNYMFFGTEPFGYHLTNLILHAFNSVMVFLVVSLIFSTAGPRDKGLEAGIHGSEASGLFSRLADYTLSPAFVTAIFFAAHPVHTESVAWVKGRDDLIALFFFLSAFYFYIKSTNNSRPVDYSSNTTLLYILSLFFYILSLLSKEMAITLPLILILYDYLLVKRPVAEGKGGTESLEPGSQSSDKRYTLNSLRSTLYSQKRYLPFFLSALFYFIVRTIVLGRVEQTGSGFLTESLASKVFMISKGTAYYIKLLVWPVNLSADYMVFPVSRSLDLQVAASFLLLGLILIGTVLVYRFSRLAAFSILWFFVTILPVSNIIPIKISIAERFLYIPSLSFCLLVGVVLQSVQGRGYKFFRFSKTLVLLIILSVVILYSFGTYERNKVWKDEFSLWSDAVKKYPNNPRAHSNLGVSYRKKGLLDNAIKEHETAVSLSPNYAPLHYNLGFAYHQKGLLNKAVEEYRFAIKLNPYYPSALFNLADVSERIGDKRGAVNYYKRFIEVAPSSSTALIVRAKERISHLQKK